MMRHKYAVPGIVLLAFLITFAPYWLRPGELPFSNDSDLLRHYLPFKEVLNQLYHDSGEFPGWEPYTLAGRPLIADPGTGAFYPFAFLFYFFPPASLFSWFFLFHVILGGTLTFYFLRAHRVSVGAAWLGTAIYSLNLKLISSLYVGYMTMVPAQAWLPGAFLAAFYLKKTTRLRSRIVCIWALGAALALQILAGDAQLAVYTVLGVAGYGWLVPVDQYRAIRPGSIGAPQTRTRMTFFIGTAFSLAVAYVLSSPLIQLTRLVTNESTRVAGVAYPIATLMSLPPSHLPAFFLPSLSGYASDGTYRGPTSFWEVSFYPGFLSWILVLVLLLRYRVDRRILPLLFLSYVLLMVSFGRYSPFYALLYYLVPWVNHFRGPARILPLVGLLFSLLAALGFDTLFRLQIEALGRKLRPLFCMPALPLVALIGWLLVDHQGIEQSLEKSIQAAGQGRGIVAWWAILEESLVALLMLGGLYFSARAADRSAISRHRSRLLVVGMIVFDLTFHTWGLLRTRPRSEVLPAHAAAQDLATHPTMCADGIPGRVLDLTGALTDAIAVSHRLAMVGGMNPLVQARLYTFSRYLQGESPEIPTDRSVYGVIIGDIRHPRLLDLLRITDILTEDERSFEGFVKSDRILNTITFQQFRGMVSFPVLIRYRRELPPPPVWWIRSIITAPKDPEETLKLLDSLDLSRQATLEMPNGITSSAILPSMIDPPLFRTVKSTPERANDKGIDVVVWLPNRIKLKVLAPAGGGVLVLSELFSEMWSATIDGVAEPLWRANYLLRAVVVPDGTHTVTFSFHYSP